MKVKKKWKKYVHQIALACLLICSVVQWVPESAYADYLYDSSHNTNHYKYTFNTTLDNKPYSVTYDLQGTSPIFLVEHKRKDITHYYFVSEQDWTGSKIINEDGTVRSFSINAFANRCDKWGAFYQNSGGDTSISGNPPRWVWDADKYDSLIASGKSDACPGENYELHYNAKLLFAKNKYALGDLVCEVGDGISGSVDNPIENDEEIGTPIITKRRYTTVYHDTDTGNASDGKEDIDDSQFIFDWSNKTSTGFNLKKNKYHMTRIQIKVQSKCVVYSGFSHKTVKKRFDNYGEMSSEIKSALVDDTPYSIEYGTVKSMLPKTFSEKHNPLYVGRNFTFYFRVMCNESASGTGKWHCGAWRAVGLNASTTQDQTDESSNGHIDSDGNYTKDPDDGHNNSDSDSSTVDDKEDAKDQFKDDQKNDVTNGKNDSSGFEWSDLKKLVNECKEVPALIKSIFSFLPDWVLVFVAVGFGIWIFVLIKRAIV